MNQHFHTTYEGFAVGFACFLMQMCVQDVIKQRVKEEHDKATADNVVDKQVVWSGTSVGLVNSIEHAEDVVETLMRDFKSAICQAAKLFAEPQVLGQGS